HVCHTAHSQPRANRAPYLDNVTIWESSGPDLTAIPGPPGLFLQSHTHTQLYTHTHTTIQTHTHTQPYTHARAHTHTHRHAHTRTHAHTHTDTHTRTHT